MKKQEKTNVMRILDQKKIPYEAHTYDSSEAISGTEVAKVLGQNPNQVFKTLVTVGASKRNYVFVVPVEAELNLKKAAKAVGEKNIVPASALHTCVCANSLQSCPNLCNPMDCGMSGFFVHGGFSRQEYWSGLSCPPPRDLLDPGIEPTSLRSLAFVSGFFTYSTT